MTTTNKESKTVSLTLEDAKKLYFSDNEHFKTIALGAFTKDELEKKELPKSWKDLETVEGWYIDSDTSSIINAYDTTTSYKNNFATEEQARSALAYAQLTQLIKAYNGDWEPDWRDMNTPKFYIARKGDSIETYDTYTYHQLIVFKTEELRDEFFNNFQDLLKEYFMI